MTRSRFWRPPPMLTFGLSFTFALALPVLFFPDAFTLGMAFALATVVALAVTAVVPPAAAVSPEPERSGWVIALIYRMCSAVMTAWKQMRDGTYSAAPMAGPGVNIGALRLNC